VFGVMLMAGIAMGAFAEDGSFDSDGVTIHYQVQGEGAPVLLIHGFSANPQVNWVGPGVVPALVDDFQVITIENRGHGKSGKPYEIEAYGTEMVEDLRRLLDHLEIDKAHIVGYSMGGFMTNLFRAKYPERCITAVLGGAGWSREGDGGDTMRNAIAEGLEAGKGLGPLFTALTPEGEDPPSADEIEMINAVMMSSNDPKALAAVARGMGKLTVTEESLKSNEVPTLALCGTKDPLIEGVYALDGVMANLDIIPIYGADHMNAMGMPQFITTLEAWLATHSREAAMAETASE
jgi:pimeloyl-ACP methyl ester carboxylesterase